VLRRGGERGESKIQNVFGKNHRREILRREKPEANTVRAKADSVRWARMSGKIPASEYWYAGAWKNVSPWFIGASTIWLLPR
jgi:hypothetical protein